MITNRDITLFNSRLDMTTRQGVFIPTNISGVSYYEADSSSGTGDRTEDITCKLRIPITALIEKSRSYLPEIQYKALSDDEAVNYWTLQRGSYILIASAAENVSWTDGLFDSNQMLSKDELDALSENALYIGPLISVVEYSNNTIRGSTSVQHWRIGGR